MKPTDTGYSVPPFPPFPSTSRYVAIGSVQEAMDRVCRSIDALEGLAMIIGPPGTGKSLICNLLVEQYESSHEIVMLGEASIETRDQLLQHLLHRLGVGSASQRESDLQIALMDRVCGPASKPGGMMIIADEAQSLSSEVIEAIRMITNITRDGKPRIMAILCGGVKLEETLVLPSMEAVTQRVATRCYLHPMNSQETTQYIAETIRGCGAIPEQTISEEAIAAVHHACSGVPRLINQLMTEAIDAAAEMDQTLMSEQVIDRAWARLQQLPSPMVEEPKITSAAVAEVEFGQLSEPVSCAPADTPSMERCEETAPACNVDTGIEVASDTASLTDESATSGSMTSESMMEERSFDVNEMAGNAVDPQTAIEVAGLFGEFDEEEVLEMAAPMTPPPRMTSVVETEIESQLLSDVCEMGHEIVAMQMYPAEEANPSMMDVEERPEVIPMEESVAEEATTTSESPEPMIYEMRMTDDSDLLIVEDEVELRQDAGGDAGVSSQPKKQAVALDFQSMLNRMRTNV